MEKMTIEIEIEMPLDEFQEINSTRIKNNASWSDVLRSYKKQKEVQ